MDNTLTITQDNKPLCLSLNLYMNFFIQNISLHPSATAMYSTTIVDSATHICNLDCYEIAPPAEVIRHLDVDFLVSMSLAILAFVGSCSTALSFPK